MNPMRDRRWRVLVGTALVLGAPAVAACGPSSPSGAPAAATARVRAALGTVATQQTSLATGAAATTGGVGADTGVALLPLGAAARDRMDEIRGRLNALGLTTVTNQGTINLAGATLSPGTHVLRATCGQSVSHMTALCTNISGTLPASTPSASAASAVSIASAGSAASAAAAPSGTSARSAAPSAAAEESGEPAHVTRYTDDTLTDVSVIIADKVVFDHATLTLSDAVRELWIVAETIESTDSLIQWQHGGSTADAIDDVSCASDASRSYDPNGITSASAFTSPDGGFGAFGSGWKNGNPGLRAPDVYVYVKYFSTEETPGSYHISMPAIHVAGQRGGVGRRGQCAGDGGNGAKGANAVQNWVNCTQGPGYGGDGGDGGDGGPGGPGGPGGDGGILSFQFVELPHVAIDESIYETAGGHGGDGGDGGEPGDGGKGGQEGDPAWPYCLAAPDRAGKHGKDGKKGARGTDGDAGQSRRPAFSLISASDWEVAFTAPYIESAAPAVAAVGASVTFNTLNLTGGASISIVDEDGSARYAYSLTDLGGGQYRWDTPRTLSAGKYVVTLIRLSDSRATQNTYRVELTSIVDGVVFASPYDAVFGGPAKLTGLGLRSDAQVLIDGVDIGPVELCTTKCPSGRQEISFTIPIKATKGKFFARDDGTTQHTLTLHQPYQLTDPPGVKFLLKRQAGLTFRPSVNGYPFSNAVLTKAAKDDAALKPWSSFRETYGGAEVDTYALAVPPMLAAVYEAWRAFWSPTSAGALCTAISSSSLDDYFKGVTGVTSYQTSDVAHTVMVRQGHILGREFLSAMAGQTVTGSAFSTDVTLLALTSFMETGTDSMGGSTPVLIMVPSLTVYLSAINLVLTNLDASSIGTAFDSIVTALGSSHSLAPYNIVYANPSDPLPSRVYFYDSNAALTDGLYLTTNNTGTTFNYALGGYSTTAAWTLASATIDFLHSDASLPLPPPD